MFYGPETDDVPRGEDIEIQEAYVGKKFRLYNLCMGGGEGWEGFLTDYLVV